ncbi:HTH domain-containing protein [Citrobacter sp. FDAARGOS_156]|uniref:HTH domain-containing protein n=1 Tax=Citrobacter sp. FDAARGOS_156 TaxID=1702170 RepID=UPI00076B657D|nr:HTH domain-containing protein [Citrobacter sp. FDAARGOS_156]AMH12973.1 HTH domain-containing protein [Citrobacter sp. FDAARGOS_156]
MFDRQTRGSRMISIVIELYQSGAHSIEMLENKFNVGSRTIYRDLEQLEPMVIKTSTGTYGLTTHVHRALDKYIHNE